MSAVREKTTYRRLPGRAGSLVLHRAYLGPDHILAVQTVFARERYRRLFFRDIASFSIHRTERSVAITIVAALGMLLGLALAWHYLPERPRTAPIGTILWGAAAAGCLAGLVANLILGPTCTCFIRTAVQTVELRSLNRVRRARKARSLLVERITAAQAEFAAPPLPAGSASAPGSPPPGGAGRLSAGLSPEPVALRDPPSSSGRAVRRSAPAGSAASAVRMLGATSGASVLAAAGISYDFIEAGPLATLATLLGALLAMVAAVIMLVVGRGGRLPRAALAVGWAVPVAMMAGVAAAYVAFIAVIAVDPMSVEPGQMDVFSIVTSLPPGTHSVVDACYLTMAGLFLAIGLCGGILWASASLRRQTSSPSAPTAA